MIVMPVSVAPGAAGHHLCGRQQRHGAHRHLQRRVSCDPVGGRAEGRSGAGLRQQTGVHARVPAEHKPVGAQTPAQSHMLLGNICCRLRPRAVWNSLCNILPCMLKCVQSSDQHALGCDPRLIMLRNLMQCHAAWCLTRYGAQDLPGALDDAAVAEGLGLPDIKNRDWAIFKTSAIKGDGLFEGLDWLSNSLKTRR